MIFDRSTLAKQAPEVWPLCGHRKEQVKDFAFVVRRRAKSHRRPTNGSRLSAVRSPIERRALRRINRVTRSCCVATYAGRRKFHCGTVGDSRPINEHRTGHLCELGFLWRFAAARRCGLVHSRRAGNRHDHACRCVHCQHATRLALVLHALNCGTDSVVIRA